MISDGRWLCMVVGAKAALGAGFAPFFCCDGIATYWTGDWGEGAGEWGVNLGWGIVGWVKEMREMRLPIVIVSRKRWKEMTERARRAQSDVDGLSRDVDALRCRLSRVNCYIDELRRDLRSLRRMLNKKERSWQYIGK